MSLGDFKLDMPFKQVKLDKVEKLVWRLKCETISHKGWRVEEELGTIAHVHTRVHAHTHTPCWGAASEEKGNPEHVES